MLSQIRKGHQCYVVCPLIDASEAGIDSVETTYVAMNQWFGKYPLSVATISGNMKETKIHEAIDAFSRGRNQDTDSNNDY